MKYVILRNPDIEGLEEAVMFGDSFPHKMFTLFNPVSAGFVAIEGEDIHVYGYSDSLQIGPRPQDEDIIRRAIVTKQTIFIEDEMTIEVKNGQQV